MTKPVLPFLETMITQVCNLSCEGCTNYSDLVQQGYVPWALGKDWLSAWMERIEIPDFGIMGGEPLINPQVREWLIGTRELLPDAQIRFTTNGLLLEKHVDVVDLCHELGNVSFKISVHTHDARLESVIGDIFRRYNWTSVNEYGVDRWLTTNDFRFHVRRPDTFIKSFKGTYDNMQPWNTDPVDAFKICIQPRCPLLYDGKIFKCSTAGLLDDVLDRHGRPNKEQWENYIPRGLSPNSSDAEINAFINNFGRPNAICGQCPDSTTREAFLIHHITVKKK